MTTSEGHGDNKSRSLENAKILETPSPSGNSFSQSENQKPPPFVEVGHPLLQLTRHTHSLRPNDSRWAESYGEKPGRVDRVPARRDRTWWTQR